MRSVPVTLAGTGVRLGLPCAEAVTMSTGFSELDQRLDGGGWPAGVLTELRIGHAGIGELRLLMPVLAPLSRKAHVLWVAPPYKPYAPALVAQKMALERLILVYPRTHREALWAVSQGLLSPSIGAVVSWFPAIREGEFRNLQRRASEGHHWAFCFLPETLAPRPSRLRLALRPTHEGLRIVFSRKAKRPLAPLVITL
ncbi:MAG TPA: translesion DNA synthesis-associated protein ImuA [Acidiferrobacter sp.]|nr:translesion DNA synthesis-associated protein ImuA [Acidiferrobacter sp.]